MADDTHVAPTGGFRPWAVGLMQMAGGGLESSLAPEALPHPPASPRSAASFDRAQR